MLIKDITADKATQSRDTINEDVVFQYAELMKDGVKFPPLEVFSDGVTNWLVDGFHRYFACQKAGIKEMEVVVHKGTKRDAKFYSFGVNDDHGLSRNNQTKHKILMEIFNDVEWDSLSDSEIHDHTGLSRTFIRKVREMNKVKRPEVKTVVRGGKEFQVNTAKIGKSKPSSPPPEPVDTLSVIEEDENETILELSSLNQELHDENVKLKDKMTALSGDEEKIDNEFLVLRSTIKALEAELQAVKNSRDQFQNKNADLIKQVSYWRKRAEKAEKALA